MGLRYGGKIVSDYSAMRGPCPDGFHVPSKDELNGLINAISTLQLSLTRDIIKVYLKAPPAGYRSNTSGSAVVQDSINFWACTQGTNGNTRGWILAATSSGVNFSQPYKAGGESIRGFKDSPVTPDNSWTTLYDGTSVATGAGIYHNSTLGLISISSDGSNWITIADKNLGATVLYNTGDTLTDANCGYFYQWGNNYGFPHSGTITTSSTKVDARNYGPGNYYYSDTFITSSGDWSSVTNANLRGGVTGVQQRPAPIVKRYYGGKMVDDYSAMRGPCDEGFHVPMRSEWVALCGILINTFGLADSASTMETYLKMPQAGRRVNTSSSVGSVGTSGLYWHSTPYPNSDNAYLLGFSSSSISPQNRFYRMNGYSLRCFKDSSVIPDSNWTILYDGSNIATNAGIFRNQSLGLISISGDGTTRYTIMDKNLGATTVFNQGDTLTDANCGYFYQRGNNYGFPHSGAVTASSTLINVSNYGPGNYYSSNTFITGSGDWASPHNDNLRGSVTGVQQRPAEVIKVYKGNTLIREKP